MEEPLLKYKKGFIFAEARYSHRSQGFLCDESEASGVGNKRVFPTLVPAMAVTNREGYGLE